MLVKLYTRGIIYKAGFDTDIEVKVAENLRVKDNINAHGISVTANQSYQDHIGKFRR